MSPEDGIVPTKHDPNKIPVDPRMGYLSERKRHDVENVDSLVVDDRCVTDYLEYAFLFLKQMDAQLANIVAIFGDEDEIESMLKEELELLEKGRNFKDNPSDALKFLKIMIKRNAEKFITTMDADGLHMGSDGETKKMKYYGKLYRYVLKFKK